MYRYGGSWYGTYRSSSARLWLAHTTVLCSLLLWLPQVHGSLALPELTYFVPNSVLSRCWMESLAAVCTPQISYSFEISSAYLARPPRRPPEPCRWRCTGKACACERRVGAGEMAVQELRPSQEQVVGAPTPDIADEAGNGAAHGQRAHHSMHRGMNDVATLVLEDNQGRTYDFYTFQVQQGTPSYPLRASPGSCRGSRQAPPVGSFLRLGAVRGASWAVGLRKTCL